MTLACFFCGVDSDSLMLFLGITVGSAVLSILSFAIWGISSGHLREEKRLARTPLAVEDEETVGDTDAR